jgi:hypothetical protein
VPIVLPLLALDVLVIVLWTIALALAIALIMRKVGDVFRYVPIVGGAIAGAVDSVAQVISNAAGSLEHGADKLAGAAWHQLARYMDHLWSQLVAHSHLYIEITHELVRHAYALTRLRSLVHKAVATAEAFIPRVKALEREWHGIEHRVKALEQEWTKGIGHDLRIHVKALEHALGRVEHKVIPNIRSIADKAEADVIALRKWVKDNALVAGTAAFTGAVAWALASLGLGWLRCDSNPFNNNKRACGLWDDLAGLLGLVTAVLVAEDFEKLVREMQAVEGEAIDVAKDLFNIG